MEKYLITNCDDIALQTSQISSISCVYRAWSSNVVNEDTRMQLELINQSLIAEFGSSGECVFFIMEGKDFKAKERILIKSCGLIKPNFHLILKLNNLSSSKLIIISQTLLPYFALLFMVC